MQENIINIISNVIVEEVYIDNYCGFQIYDATTCGCYIIQWTKFTDVIQVPWIRTECDPPGILLTGTLVCEAKCSNSMGANSFWYHEQPEYLTVLVRIKTFIHVNLTLTGL